MIDWQTVVLNIRQAGMPVSAIARKVNMDGNTLRHYARGECSEPRFSQGCALLDLHYSLCPDKHNLDSIA